jgi:hypothetical protein
MGKSRYQLKTEKGRIIDPPYHVFRKDGENFLLTEVLDSGSVGSKPTEIHISQTPLEKGVMAVYAHWLAYEDGESPSAEKWESAGIYYPYLEGSENNFVGLARMYAKRTMKKLKVLECWDITTGKVVDLMKRNANRKIERLERLVKRTR